MNAANAQLPNPPAPPPLGVVILAAGASSRMGRPKLLLPWGDTSVLGHLIGQWRQLQARQIAVVCATDPPAVLNELDRLRFPASDRIVNPAPEQGMFSSVRAAARWDHWQPDLTGFAIVLGDQPHLRFETLCALSQFQVAHPDSSCQPSAGGRRGHPVILSRRAFQALAETGAPNLRVFLAGMRGPMAAVPVDDPGLALDLDTPEDYARAVQRNFKPYE